MTFKFVIVINTIRDMKKIAVDQLVAFPTVPSFPRNCALATLVTQTWIVMIFTNAATHAVQILDALTAKSAVTPLTTYHGVLITTHK